MDNANEGSDADLTAGDASDDAAIGDTQEPAGHWPSDTGTLPIESRRALVALVRGPYVSAERHRDSWRALLDDTAQIRSRLADLFLDLVIDQDFGIAFVRGVRGEDEALPQVVRSTPLTLIDSAMLLHLRSELLRAGTGTRCFVGRDEVYDHMELYRAAASTDQSGFQRRLGAAWKKFDGLGILLSTSEEGRFEVSQVLRLIFGADEVSALRTQFAELAQGSGDASE